MRMQVRNEQRKPGRPKMPTGSKEHGNARGRVVKQKGGSIGRVVGDCESSQLQSHMVAGRIVPPPPGVEADPEETTRVSVATAACTGPMACTVSRLASGSLASPSSAPRRFSPSPSPRAVAKSQAAFPRIELENRLGELELALGLPL